MSKWVLVASAILLIGAVAAVWIGRARESFKARQMADALVQNASSSARGLVDFASFSGLPPPVARYLKQVLTDGQKFISLAKMRQSGVLRISTSSAAWSSFTARQLVVPSAPGFVWKAKVQMPLATHAQVLDSYMAGAGAGRISLFSAFALAKESRVPELNAGALHRYLAEAVWYPTALLPQAGVVWAPIDDRAAIATLTDSDTTVSLEFRFNEAGEVSGIYSPGRFGRFDGVYRQVPWEGHFQNYQTKAGMRVPHYGEVGWYERGVLKLVWKGNVIGAQYEFEP